MIRTRTINVEELQKDANVNLVMVRIGFGRSPKVLRKGKNRERWRGFRRPCDA